MSSASDDDRAPREAWNVSRAAQTLIDSHGKRALSVAEKRAADAANEDTAKKWREIAKTIREITRWGL